MALAGACVLVLLWAASPASAVGGLRPLTVDASRPVGVIRSLQGVSGSPLPGDDSHPDLTAQHRALGVDLVRTHDLDCSGTGDLDGAAPNRIFPDWSADPNDPRSYNFGPTDRALLSIVRAGEQIEFNLGHSDLRCAGIDTNNVPPPDPVKYARVARRVAQHYNDGWAGGYHLGIRYWEIWNEPDLIPFWAGTREGFYALYAATSRALKSLHPWMQIGGPALATDNDLTGYRESLLSYLRAHDLPLDFWSIHHYADFTEDPVDFPRLAREHRALLDAYGFRRTTIHLNEWNYGLIDAPSPMQRAAFVADSLLAMQDAPIARAAFYRFETERGGGDFGLARPDGTLSKAGYAFGAVGSLKRTPLRLRATGDDPGGLAVEAGRSPWTGETRVLVSNYEIPPEDRAPLPFPFPGNLFTIPGIATFTILDRRPVTYRDNAGYDLTVAGLRGHRRYTVERYRLDADHDLTLVDRSVQRGPRVRLTAALPAPAVELVVLRPARRATGR